MRPRLSLVLSIALATSVSLWVVPAQAAGRPAVSAAVEGRESATGRSLVTVLGKQLTKVTAADVLDGAQMSVGAAEIVSRSASALVLRLPDGLPAGSYTLALAAGKGEPIPVAIRAAGPALLTDGSNAMTGALRSTSNDGMLLGGTFEQGGDPPSGAGVRMFWYPKKYALRAGRAIGDEWDPANIGEGSIAIGRDCRSTGFCSVAMGSGASANDAGGVAIGADVVAHGAAVALGAGCRADGGGVAIGFVAAATGFASSAIGFAAEATGDLATSIGTETVAQSYGSFVVGTGNVIAGTATSAVATDPLFVCGNGTSAARSNALTLLRNGNMTISGTLTQNSDARLKKDVTALVGVGEKLAKLHGVSYAFTDPSKHPEGRHIGLLAQEVREAFPELVTEGPDGTLSVAYGNFSAVLLEALKEQSSEVASLRRAHVSEIAARDAKLAERDAEIASLRKDQAALSERLARIEALLEKTK